MGVTLVTGAAGFVGANLCKHLLFQNKSEVIALQRPNGNSWRLQKIPGLKTAELDLTSSKNVLAFFRDVQPSVLINCAAYGAYSNQKDINQIYSTNFEGVRNLLEASKALTGLRAFIQCGSSSEYGLNCSAPLENSPTLPDSHYSVSKVSATALVQYYGKSQSIPAWVLRLYSIYGPDEEPSRLIPTLLLCAKEKKFPLLVHPEISRDFLYIDDLCSAVDQVITQSKTLTPGEVFNIGSGKKTTLRDMVQLIGKLFNVTEEPQWGSMENRNWDHQEWFSNPEKAKSVLGWQAQVSLEEGLKKTKAWMEDKK